MASEFTLRKQVDWSYDETLTRLPEILKSEGFGVVTELDVKKTLKEKIGVDFRRYKILGACNPSYAHQALSAAPEVGVMLPCNVVVFESDGSGTTVLAIDPMATLAASIPALASIATEVRARLERVVSKLG